MDKKTKTCRHVEKQTNKQTNKQTSAAIDISTAHINNQETVPCYQQFCCWFCCSDRMNGVSSGDVDQTQENQEYTYSLQYLNFCQPVGPRLGK